MAEGLYGTVNTQITRQDPEIEKYRRALLSDVQGFVKKQISDPQAPPSYEVAGLGSGEQRAINLASQGVGAYQPFIQGGSQAISGGQSLINQGGVGALQQGIGALGGGQTFINQAANLAANTRNEPYGYQAAANRGVAQTLDRAEGMFGGTTGSFDPSNIQNFMNPYEDQAVNQALSDIQRSADIQQNQLNAQAVGAGAFGGSRQGIQQAELDRNALEQQGRTAAQMRQAGFVDAANRAQQAFEASQGRGQAAASQLGQFGLQGAQQQGNLGVQYGQLGQQDVSQLLSMGGQQQALGQGLGSLASQYGQFGSQLGQLGGQQAGLGSMQSSLNTQDLTNLTATGAMERGVRQAGLDARRLTDTSRQAQPYQQYGFLSDIYMGTPTSQQTVTGQTAPQVSPFQTALGLGIQGLSAASGASRMGLF